LKKDISIEELVVEILSKALSVSLDPNERFEFHFKLAEKLLSEAKELLAKSDYIQAPEKTRKQLHKLLKL